MLGTLRVGPSRQGKPFRADPPIARIMNRPPPAAVPKATKGKLGALGRAPVEEASWGPLGRAPAPPYRIILVERGDPKE